MYPIFPLSFKPALHPRVRGEGEDQQGVDRPMGLPQVRLPAQGGRQVLLLQEQRTAESEVRYCVDHQEADTTVWGVNLLRKFCSVFSESSTGQPLLALAARYQKHCSKLAKQVAAQDCSFHVSLVELL